jgi:DNA primase
MNMNDVEEVKNRLDIVEIVAGYVELKKAGKDYRGLSPFRSEKTPSFFVSPDKQIWHDFGANEGGDVISFVMRAEGLSFPEALEMLAAKAGVILKPRRQSDSSERKSNLYPVLELAVKYYHFQLSRNQVALDYLLKDRGISKAAIKAFKLGYAPEGWTNFTEYALQRGLVLGDLIRAGITANSNRSKGGYDIFRDRVMFPIFDAQSRPVGFSARVLNNDQKTAKYVNTSDTPIYHKSSALYGLVQAKDAIRELDYVLLVEGNLDVIALWQHGQKNVVAASGTALTADQIKILSRLTNTIKLCFDQDEAGLKATLRAIELAQDTDVRVEVITIEGAKDPDELIRQNSADWQKHVDTSEYAIDFLFDYAAKKWGIKSGPSKKTTTQFLVPVLRKLRDRIELSHYIQRLSQLVQVDEGVIKALVEQKPNSKKMNTKVEQTDQDKVTSQDTKPLTKRARLEEMFLELVVAYPDSRMALDDVDRNEISTENQAIFDYLTQHKKATEQAIVKALPNSEERVKMLGLRGSHEYSELTEHERGLEAFTQVHNLLKHTYTQKKRQLQREIAQAEAQGDVERAAKKLQQYQAIMKRASEL